MDRTEIRKDLKDRLSKKRFEHTIGVMYTAGAMAMRYGIDIEQAMLAGLLHDCAKYSSDKEKLAACEKYEIPITDVEM